MSSVKFIILDVFSIVLFLFYLGTIELPTADILSVVIFYLSLEDRIPFERAIPICGYNS